VITIHQRHRQTDRQTDRQTTCDRNTALCTKVYRAVKTEKATRTTVSVLVYTIYSCQITLVISLTVIYLAIVI